MMKLSDQADRLGIPGARKEPIHRVSVATWPWLLPGSWHAPVPRAAFCGFAPGFHESRRNLPPAFRRAEPARGHARLVRRLSQKLFLLGDHRNVPGRSLVQPQAATDSNGELPSNRSEYAGGLNCTKRLEDNHFPPGSAYVQII